jgi:hypothetical protein
MRAATPLAVGAFVFASAVGMRDAAADPPEPPRTNAMSLFASLPEGHVPLLPRTPPPSRIAPGAAVRGFVIADSPGPNRRNSRRSRPDVTYVSPDDDLVKAQSQGAPVMPSDVCMVDGGDAASLAGTDDTQPADFPACTVPTVAFQSRTDRVPRRGGKPVSANVHIVRVERFIAGENGRASLEIADAWVDAGTRGGRLLQRSTVPLSRVFVGPNGLEVYAARDGDALEVVFHVPDHLSDDPALDSQLRSQMQGMAVFLPDNTGANPQSGHLRTTLRAYGGAGQMETLQAVAFLPPLDGETPPPLEGESDQERANREFHAMRLRPYQLTVSATAASTDTDPVVSIALGWTGREGPAN